MPLVKRSQALTKWEETNLNMRLSSKLGHFELKPNSTIIESHHYVLWFEYPPNKLIKDNINIKYNEGQLTNSNLWKKSDKITLPENDLELTVIENENKSFQCS